MAGASGCLSSAPASGWVCASSKDHNLDPFSNLKQNHHDHEIRLPRPLLHHPRIACFPCLQTTTMRSLNNIWAKKKQRLQPAFQYGHLQNRDSSWWRYWRQPQQWHRRTGTIFLLPTRTDTFVFYTTKFLSCLNYRGKYSLLGGSTNPRVGRKRGWARLCWIGYYRSGF